MIKKAILSFALVLAVAVGAFTMFHKAFNAFAQSGTHYISGYGWSSNYGWISFDCADLSYCGTANYKVSIDSAGNLSGYAWVNPRDTVSGVNNVGWLQFGGLSGFPTSDPNTTATNAKIVTVGTSKSMVGWARFCSGSATPASCAGGAGTNTGGWDGWVSFSGTNHGISLSNLDSPIGSGNYPFTGYAWGGDWVDNNSNSVMDSSSIPSEVIGPGWIDLSKAIAHLDPSNNDASMQLYGNGQPVPASATTGVLTLNVSIGDPLLLSWDTFHMSSCTATSNDMPYWTGAKSAIDTTPGNPHKYLPARTYTAPGVFFYLLSCTKNPTYGPTGTIVQEVVVNVRNSAFVILDAVASPQVNTNSYTWDVATSSLLPAPATPTLSWWGQGLDTSQKCTASVVPAPGLTLTNGGLGGWDTSTQPGSTGTSSSPLSKSVSTPPINPSPGPASVRYMISCKAIGGTIVTDIADIGIKDSIPALDLALTATPTSVTSANQFKTTLKYSTIASDYKDCSATAADDATGDPATTIQIPNWVDPGAPTSPTWNKPAPTPTNAVTVGGVYVPFTQTRFAITCRELNNVTNMMTATVLVTRPAAPSDFLALIPNPSVINFAQPHVLSSLTLTSTTNGLTGVDYNACVPSAPAGYTNQAGVTFASGISSGVTVNNSVNPSVSGWTGSLGNLLSTNSWTKFFNSVAVPGTLGDAITYYATCENASTPGDFVTAEAHVSYIDDSRPQVDLGGSLTGGAPYNYNTTQVSPLVLAVPGPVNLEWKPKDVQSCVASYTAASGGTVTPTWTGQKNPNNGTYAAGPFIITKSTTFRIDCFPPTGSAVHDIVFTCVDDGESCTTVNPPTGAKKPKFIEF